MIEAHKKAANRYAIVAICGFALIEVPLIVAGYDPASTEMSGYWIQAGALMFGIGLIIGAIYYAKAKGWSGWWGGLGIIFPIAWIILLFKRDKHKAVDARDGRIDVAIVIALLIVLMSWRLFV